MEYRTEFFKTMQPYFVMSTSCFYQEIFVNYGISHFYGYDVENEEEPVIVVPDGCIDIIFVFDDTGITSKACGTVLEHSHLFQEKKKSYFGIRFLPGVLPWLLDIKKNELIGKQINLNDIIKVKNLEQDILEAGNFEKRKQIFIETYLNNWKEDIGMSKKQYLITALKQEIYHLDGDIKIKELEELTGYTGRYLDKVLKEEIGIGTKAFCKIVKFQKILNRMSHDTTTRLSDLAMDFGYYDQAHFIRSFRVNTSMSPKEYRNMILKKEYVRRLVNIR